MSRLPAPAPRKPRANRDFERADAPLPAASVTQDVSLLFRRELSATRVHGRGELRARGNLYGGSDHTRKRTSIPLDEKVARTEAWPGAELRLLSRAGRLAYEIELKPGANLGEIALEVDGVERVDAGANSPLKNCSAVPPGRRERLDAPRTRGGATRFWRNTRFPTDR